MNRGPRPQKHRGLLSPSSWELAGQLVVDGRERGKVVGMW